MCTVTVLKTDVRGAPITRMLVNRDESRHRPDAYGPILREVNGVPVLMPIDPQSDGTWVAINGFGLMLTLLNYNPTNRDRGFPRGPRSRGEIIPLLADAPDVAAATKRAAALDGAAYAPFRLAVVDGETALIAIGDAGRMRIEVAPLGRTLVLASSGLGDELVEGPRGALFAEMFPPTRPPADPIATQDAYHRHLWPDRPHLSVWMSRAEAWTTGLTVAEAHVTTVSMTYAARADVECGAPPAALSMPRDAGRCPAGR